MNKNATRIFFSEGVRRCKKEFAKPKLKEKTTPVFLPKRNVLFAALDAVNSELDRLGKMGLIFKINYSEWGAPCVYVIKTTSATTKIDQDWTIV